MTIIDVTDVHGNARHLERIAAAAAKADLLIVSGDITNFGGRAEAAEIIEPLARTAKRILAVAGNCDTEEVELYLDEKGINLGGRSLIFEGVCFVGLGGSLPGPMQTPHVYSEEQLAAFLDQAGRTPGMPLVLISHQPPRDTRLDLAGGRLHVGSRSVRSYIERERPLLCFTGHIHESSGIDTLAGCVIINPGPLAHGGYVRAVIENGEPALATIEKV